MIDILNKHFQDSLHINKAQSGLVQFANYIAYFLMAIPAGLLARKFGYKGGIIVGLVLFASGAFWFIPATHIGTYWAFLIGLSIVAIGMTCLEAIANPYTTLLGATESGVQTAVEKCGGWHSKSEKPSGAKGTGFCGSGQALDARSEVEGAGGRAASLIWCPELFIWWRGERSCDKNQCSATHLD
jgi:hypothetical protein